MDYRRIITRCKRCNKTTTTRKRGAKLNYNKIIFEIDDDLKEKFLLYLVKNKSTQKEVLTEYIKKLVGTTTSKGEK